MPIRGRPDIGNGIDRFVFRKFQFQSETNGQRQRIKLVNNFEARVFAEIVDAGNVDQVIERQIVAAEFCDFAQIGWPDAVSRLAAKLGFVLKLLPEQLA